MFGVEPNFCRVSNYTIVTMCWGVLFVCITYGNKIVEYTQGIVIMSFTMYSYPFNLRSCVFIPPKAKKKKKKKKKRKKRKKP